jgi:hypothetical protein
VGSQKTEVSVPAKPRLHVENFSRNNCFSPKFGQNSKLLQKDFVFVVVVVVVVVVSQGFLLISMGEKNFPLIFILALCIKK